MPDKPMPDEPSPPGKWMVAYFAEIPMWTVTPLYLSRKWEIKNIWPDVPTKHFLIDAPNEAFALMYAQGKQEAAHGR